MVVVVVVSSADTVCLLPALGNLCCSWFVTYYKMSFSHTIFSWGGGGLVVLAQLSHDLQPCGRICLSSAVHTRDIQSIFLHVFLSGRECLSRACRQSIIAKVVYTSLECSGLDCWSFELCRSNPVCFLLEPGKNACLMHHLWKDQLLNSTGIVPLLLLNVLHRFSNLPYLPTSSCFTC